MISNELQDFITEQNQHLRSLYSNLSDDEKMVYAQTVKLSEEVGELSEAVLAHHSNQRKSKQGKDISLEKEAADVIITTLLLADSLKIDISEALQARVHKLKQRRKTD